MSIQVPSPEILVLKLQPVAFAQLGTHIIPGSKGHATLLGYSLAFPPLGMMMMAMSRGLSTRGAHPHIPTNSANPPLGMMMMAMSEV